MPRRLTPHRSQLSVLQGLDLLLVNLSLLAGVAVKHAQDPGVVWNDQYLTLLLVFNLAWLGAAQLTGLYRQLRLEPSTRQIWKWAEVIFLHLLIVTLFIVARKGYLYSRLALLYAFTCLALSMILVRTAYRWWLARRFKNFRWSQQVAIVGYGEPVKELVGYLRSHPELGSQCVGFFSSRPDIPVEELPYRLGEPEDLAAYLKKNPLHGLYAYLPDLTAEETERVLALADQFLVPLNVVPDFKAFRLNGLQLQYHGDLPVFYLRPHPLADSLNQTLKRAFDILFSAAFLLLVGSWLFPVLALLVRLSSPGPVFFIQPRAGRGGKPFRCLKFRTMRVHNGEFQQARKNDDRITPIGRILRKTSLDEFPQFFNVLLGHMSVVGPRPHPLPLDAQYGPLLERYKVRHVVKPGLTGLAQTRGHRGETPDVQTMHNRVRMDVFYVANWSLQLDIQIILDTALLVLKGDKQAY